MADATMNRAQPTEFGSIKWEGRQGRWAPVLAFVSVPSAAGEKQMSFLNLRRLKKKKCLESLVPTQVLVC